MSISRPELMIVMPVFNEHESIQRVIADWLSEVTRVIPDSVILVIDDGSADATWSMLQRLQTEIGTRLEILSRQNRGHGQTCMQGYRIALDRQIPFVFQIDSDGQSDPRYFREFWDRRNDFDVIYGKRSRQDGYRRVVASLILRYALRVLAKVDCVDANVPYRLMNTAACADAIRSISSAIHLANIGLAVCLKRQPAIRHGQIDIGFPPRHGGEASVPFTKFAVKAVELFRQLKDAEIR